MRLVEWVWEYYAREPARQPGDGPQTPKLQSSPVIVSGRPPLYFQHQVRWAFEPSASRCKAGCVGRTEQATRVRPDL